MKKAFCEINLNVALGELIQKMAKLRIIVEWFFVGVKRLWELTDEMHKMLLGELPVVLIDCVEVGLTNERCCFSPNFISQLFEWAPSVRKRTKTYTHANRYRLKKYMIGQLVLKSKSLPCRSSDVSNSVVCVSKNTNISRLLNYNFVVFLAFS